MDRTILKVSRALIFTFGSLVASYTLFRTYRALTSTRRPRKLSIFKKDQDQTVDDGGKIRINPLDEDDVSEEQFVRQYLPGYGSKMTAWDLFQSSCKKFAKHNFLGTIQPDKTWSWETYEQVFSDVCCLSDGMDYLNMFTTSTVCHKL